MMGGHTRAPWSAAAWLATSLLAAPLVWVLVASLTPETRLAADVAAPRIQLTLDHYRTLFAERAFLRPILNSLVVAGITTVGCLALALPASYALARLRFTGRNIVLGAVLMLSMFPQVSILSPLYLLLRALHLVDTRAGLALPYVTFTLPLTLWMLTSYVRELPREIEQAARLDGASTARTFVEIVLPMAAPGIVATGLLAFLYSWNEFLFALAFTVSPDLHTVPVAVALFRGRYQVPWGEILAAAVLAMIPVIAIVAAFERRIVTGLTGGAVKG